MKATILGRSGLDVSGIGFGTWQQLGSDCGTFDDDASVAAIRSARDPGLEDSVRAVDSSLTDSDLDEIETIMDDATSVAGPSLKGCRE